MTTADLGTIALDNKKDCFPDQNRIQNQLDIEEGRQFYELIKLLLEVDLDDVKV